MIRAATDADLPLVRELFREFMLELEDAPHRDDDTEEDLAKIEAGLANGWHVLISETDGVATGLAVAEKSGTRVGYLSSLYVRPAARGGGVAADLVKEVVRGPRPGRRGARLDVLASNEAARAIYDRWGMTPAVHSARRSTHSSSASFARRV